MDGVWIDLVADGRIDGSGLSDSEFLLLGWSLVVLTPLACFFLLRFVARIPVLRRLLTRVKRDK